MLHNNFFCTFLLTTLLYQTKVNMQNKSKTCYCHYRLDFLLHFFPIAEPSIVFNLFHSTFKTPVLKTEVYYHFWFLMKNKEKSSGTREENLLLTIHVKKSSWFPFVYLMQSSLTSPHTVNWLETPRQQKIYMSKQIRPVSYFIMGLMRLEANR